MTLQEKINKAAALQRRITRLGEAQKARQVELDALKAEIAADAQKLPETKKTDGGGKSWSFTSRSGVGVRVTQPAPRLLAQITGDLVKQLKELCGRKFGSLFEVKYSCVKNFRTEVFRALPDKETAEKVIGLCEQKSAPTVTIG